MSVSVSGTKITFNDGSKQLSAARVSIDKTTFSSNYQLTGDSHYLQMLTPTTTGLAVILPNATTLALSQSYFKLENTTPYAVNINTFDGITLFSLPAFGTAELSLKENDSANSYWGYRLYINDTEVSTIQGYAGSLIALSSTLFIITYLATSDTGPIRSVAVSYVNGTATWGTPVTHTTNAGNSFGSKTTSIALDSTRFLVMYLEQVQACSVSGTTITQGTAVTVTPPSSTYVNSPIFTKINSNTVVMESYLDPNYDAATTGTFRIINTSGTTISVSGNLTTGRPASGYYVTAVMPLGEGSSNMLIIWTYYGDYTSVYRSYSISGTTPTLVSSGSAPGSIHRNFIYQGTNKTYCHASVFNYSGATITSATKGSIITTGLPNVVPVFLSNGTFLCGGTNTAANTVYYGKYQFTDTVAYVIPTDSYGLPTNYSGSSLTALYSKSNLGFISNDQAILPYYDSSVSLFTNYLSFVSIKKIV